MTSSGRFCYTLDVLTDGSEHTGCGTLFLSVWKIPGSIPNITTASSSSDEDSEYLDSSSNSSDEDSEEEEHDPKQEKNSRIDSGENRKLDEIPVEEKKKNSDPYSWLTGARESNNDTEHSAFLSSNVPIARYAISGLGDATARLCADQRFKLAQTRACFLPELGTMARACDGLSALFLALYGAGSPSLHLVVPKLPATGKKPIEEEGDGFVEDLATIVLGAHKNLDIRTCEIADTNEKMHSLTWWKVYEDDYLIAHATSSKAFLGLEGRDETQKLQEGTASLIYLYSFPTALIGSKIQTSGKNPYCTLALLPPRCKNMTRVNERLLRQNRPMIRDGVPMTSIDYILFLDPREPLQSDFTSFPRSAEHCSQLLMTLPRTHANIHEDRGADHDEGILIRSQQLHRHFYHSMPWAFTPPPESSCKTSGDSAMEESANGIVFALKSGTSIVLEKNHSDNIQNQIAKERIWDRRESIWKKEVKEEWTRSTTDSLETFVVDKSTQLPSTTPVAVSDENEIELGDETDTEEEDAKKPVPIEIEDDNEIDLELDDEGSDESSVEEKESNRVSPSSSTAIEEARVLNNSGRTKSDPCEKNIALHGEGPRLVVLGTGCATPSAYRGSSGYAVVLPTPINSAEEFHGASQQYCYENSGASSRGLHRNGGFENNRSEIGDQIYILDCGEGVSTMLSRNCGDMSDWKRRIRGIWISHAHLDHYGGLPTLLRLLCEEREATKTSTISTNERARKRSRHSSGDLPTEIPHNTTMPVPWVIAPSKVLQYLDLVLNCNHGRCKDGTMVCFEPRLHHDPRLPLGKSSPFFHFENLKVYHNCCPAFGLLVGWKKRAKNKSNSHNEEYASRGTDNQFLCYSGDTRPSHNLVRACKRAVERQQQRYHHPSSSSSSNSNTSNTDLFLIHEATFRDAESQMAHKKKHSTLREAWEVATDIPCCSRVLMTHFSQRYDNLPVEEEALDFKRKPVSDNCNNINNQSWNSNAIPPCVGLAVDGLWIDLASKTKKTDE